jgi:hypothetical protein
MKKDKLDGLSWLVNGGGWWTERHLERWDEKDVMVYTGWGMMLGDGLKESGIDETGETAWFVLGNEWWWVVN